MKYKLITIADKDLVPELEKLSRMGFDLVEILEKVLPNASSDFVGWRVLLRSVKK